MKKLLYLLPIIIIFFASCGPVLEPPVQIGPGIDTVFYSFCEYDAPVTAPRYDCKGNRLPHPKIVGWKKDTCATVNHISFNESYLNNLGYQYVGKPVSVGPANSPNGPLPNKVSNSGWGDFPWDWIFGLLLALLLGVLIWKLFQWNVNSETPLAPTVPVTASSSASESSSTGSRNSTVHTSSFTEESKMLIDIMKGMKENDISDVSAEFPNGPKISIKKDAGTKQSKVKKEEKNEEGQDKKS